MTIAIIGAGAMGCIYATYLCEHNDVLLVDVVKEHVDAINGKGLVFEPWTAVSRPTRTCAPRWIPAAMTP